MDLPIFFAQSPASLQQPSAHAAQPDSQKNNDVLTRYLVEPEKVDKAPPADIEVLRQVFFAHGVVVSTRQEIKGKLVREFERLEKEFKPPRRELLSGPVIDPHLTLPEPGFQSYHDKAETKVAEIKRLADDAIGSNDLPELEATLGAAKNLFLLVVRAHQDAVAQVQRFEMNKDEKNFTKAMKDTTQLVIEMANCRNQIGEIERNLENVKKNLLEERK